MKLKQSLLYSTAALLFLARSIHAQTPMSGPYVFYDSVEIQGQLKVNSIDGAVFTGTYGTGALAPSGAGVRMVWNPNKVAFRAGYVGGNGWDNGNLGYYSFGAGLNTLASGYASTAFGLYSSATGTNGAFAAGNYANASGASAVALGASASATGSYSAALGYYSQASGYGSFVANVVNVAGGSYSASMGYSTSASSFASMAVGRYNVIQGNPTQWVETDPLFVIGNGTGYYLDPVEIKNRNALTVYKNGSATFLGVVRVAPGGDIPMFGQ